MATQLIVTILLVLAIIFVPYLIGRLIPTAVKYDFIFENVIYSWLFGVMAIIYS
jgi:hypothetical protein